MLVWSAGKNDKVQNQTRQICLYETWFIYLFFCVLINQPGHYCIKVFMCFLHIKAFSKSGPGSVSVHACTSPPSESWSWKEGPDVGTSELCSAGDGKGSDKDPVLEGRVVRWRSSNAWRHRASSSVQASRTTRDKFYLLIRWWTYLSHHSVPRGRGCEGMTPGRSSVNEGKIKHRTLCYLRIYEGHSKCFHTFILVLETVKAEGVGIGHVLKKKKKKFICHLLRNERRFNLKNKYNENAIPVSLNLITD